MKLHESLHVPVATALTSLALLAGCNAAPQADSRPQPSQSTQEADLLYGPCRDERDLYGSDSAITKEHAVQCDKVMREGGRVALVAFGSAGKTPAELAAEADRTEALLSQATGGLFKVTAEVVPASKAAEEAVARTGFTCASDKTKPSVIADHTMPSLRADFVIALGNWPSCSNEIGQAHFDGRHAEVHVDRTSRSLVTGQVAAHELLHLLGEGHAGVLVGEDTRPVMFGETLELGSLAHGLYDETGDSGNLAGYSLGLAHARPNPVQVDHLRWPQITLGEATPYGVRLAPGQEAAFGMAVYDKLGHAIIPLNTPVTLQSGKNGVMPFGELAIIPMLDSRGKTFLGATLFLVDKQHNIVRIDRDILRYEENHKTTMVLNHGSQKIKITMNTAGTSFAVSVLS